MPGQSEILQQVASAINNGANPQDVLKELIGQGIPQADAINIIEKGIEHSRNLPQAKYGQYYEDGGINIKPENRGKFTAQANRADMGVQEFADHVLANKDRYSPTTVKRANFANNAAKWKKKYGGDVFRTGSLNKFIYQMGAGAVSNQALPVFEDPMMIEASDFGSIDPIDTSPQDFPITNDFDFAGIQEDTGRVVPENTDIDPSNIGLSGSDSNTPEGTSVANPEYEFSHQPGPISQGEDAPEPTFGDPGFGARETGVGAPAAATQQDPIGAESNAFDPSFGFEDRQGAPAEQRGPRATEQAPIGQDPGVATKVKAAYESAFEGKTPSAEDRAKAERQEFTKDDRNFAQEQGQRIREEEEERKRKKEKKKEKKMALPGAGRKGPTVADEILGGLGTISSFLETAKAAKDQKDDMRKIRAAANTMNRYEAVTPQNPFGNYTPNAPVGSNFQLITNTAPQSLGTGFYQQGSGASMGSINIQSPTPFTNPQEYDFLSQLQPAQGFLEGIKDNIAIETQTAKNLTSQYQTGTGSSFGSAMRDFFDQVMGEDHDQYSPATDSLIVRDYMRTINPEGVDYAGSSGGAYFNEQGGLDPHVRQRLLDRIYRDVPMDGENMPGFVPPPQTNRMLDGYRNGGIKSGDEITMSKQEMEEFVRMGGEVEIIEDMTKTDY